MLDVMGKYASMPAILGGIITYSRCNDSYMDSLPVPIFAIQ